MKDIESFIESLLAKNLKKHSENVKIYSRLLSEKLEISNSKVEEISEAAYFHDIGKVFVDSVILGKEKITLEEFEEIKTHTTKGFQSLQNVEINRTIKNVVLYHHEKWDGSGYPCGLKGEEIPIEARIVSIIDVYVALREKRCYKEAMSHQSACKIIYSLSEKSFDPNIVNIFKKYSDIFKNLC